MPDQFTYTLSDIEAEIQRRAAEKERKLLALLCLSPDHLLKVE